MIGNTTREYIATVVLSWLRDPAVNQEFYDTAPQYIRDRVLHMIPGEDHGVEPAEAKRIANQIARWIASEDGYIQVGWKMDGAAVRSILKVIDSAMAATPAELRKIDNDEDLGNDMTAVTYPRLMEYIEFVRTDMKGFVREQRRIGARPKLAKQRLLQMVRGSAEDALAEVG